MKQTKELLLIKVSDLVVSPHNVRRYPSSAVGELAALIESHGLLQNLIVTEQPTGMGRQQRIAFGVVAGERRRRALVLLRQQGKLAESHEVLCELVPQERAREISLAENSGRERCTGPTSLRRSSRSYSRAAGSRTSQRDLVFRR